MPFFPKDPHVTQAELARDARARFAKRGSDPLSWLGYALALRDSARLLWDHAEAASDDAAKTERFGLTLVALMLAGLAIEVLAKALLVQQNSAVVSDFRGGKGHDIVALVERTKVPITRDQRTDLRHLSGFVTFAGRYPIPTGPEGLTPKLKGARAGKLPTIELAAGTHMSAGARVAFEAVFDRLSLSLAKRQRKKEGAKS
jgi:hypothetical protein